MFYLQKQLPKTGRHLLSHSFTEKGQRKKIIDDHDELCSEIEISKLLSKTKFSNIDINFRNIPLMFVRISQKLFQRRNFLFSLFEQFKKLGMCIFQKHKLINSNQNRKHKANENANKNKVYT